MTEKGQRQVDLFRLTAILVTLVSGLAWVGWDSSGGLDLRPGWPIFGFDQAVVYRPDGGQTMGAGVSNSGLKPNELTTLTLGKRVDLTSAHPARLAHLPGLGLKSAVSAQAKGCLNVRQRRSLHGLVTESCNQSNP